MIQINPHCVKLSIVKGKLSEEGGRWQSTSTHQPHPVTVHRGMAVICWANFRSRVYHRRRRKTQLCQRVVDCLKEKLIVCWSLLFWKVERTRPFIKLSNVGGNSLTRNTVQASPGTVCISCVFFSSCAQIWKGIERQPFGLSLEPKFYDLGKFKQWRHFHKTMQFKFKRWLPFSQHKAPEQWVKSTMRPVRFPNTFR